MKKIYGKLGFFILIFVVVISGCNHQTTQNLSKEEVVSKLEKDSNKLVTSIEKENKSTYEVEVYEKDHKKN